MVLLWLPYTFLHPGIRAFNNADRQSLHGTATQQARPWDRPFWKPIRGKEGVFTYLVLIDLLSVIGLILAVVGFVILFSMPKIAVPESLSASHA